MIDGLPFNHTVNKLLILHLQLKISNKTEQRCRFRPMSGLISAARQRQLPISMKAEVSLLVYILFHMKVE